MPRFLIEVRHANDVEGCLKALDAFMTFGSHLVSQAEFGCEDGVHCGWLVVEVPSRADAQLAVPPQLRADTRIVQLRKWTPEEIRSMVEQLSA